MGVAATIASSNHWSPRSLQMDEIEAALEQIAISDVPVLLQGETGVGKEVLARRLHASSKRTGMPLVKLNCAALPSELIESELFGYERGAFTGAFKATPGKFELANNGTVLLDEIGDMDLKLQAKLLQVLQDQEFHRLGGTEVIRVDMRVIAATHRDLEAAIAQGTFREDLYYRLSIISILIPPLRERRSEIMPLTEHFLEKHSIPTVPPPEITPALRQAFLEYSWPGNIRELENTIRRLIVMRNPDAIVQQLRSRPETGKAEQDAAENAAPARPVAPGVIARVPVNGLPVLDEVAHANKQAEAEAILRALTMTKWNRKQAAALLRTDYKALLYKMKKMGIG